MKPVPSRKSRRGIEGNGRVGGRTENREAIGLDLGTKASWKQKRAIAEARRRSRRQAQYARHLRNGRDSCFAPRSVASDVPC